MNHRAVFLLGLFASSCWQTRAVQLELQKDIIYSCPQRAVVTVTGASLMTKPVVTLAADSSSTGTSEIPALNQDEVSILPDGTLQFVLPRRLGAGNYQVLLTFKNADQTSTLSPGRFEYSLDTPNLPFLIPVGTVDGPKQPNEVMLWHPDPSRGLELAVLSENGSMLSTYPNQQTEADLPPTYDVTRGQHTNVQSSNLVLAPLDSQQQQTSALVACAPLQASGPTAALSIASTGLTLPTVQLGAVVPSAVTKGQLVASGNFFQKSTALQLIQLVLPATGTDGSIIAYKNLNLASPQTPSGVVSSVVFPVNVALPVTAVIGDLNDDSLTDVLLIGERTSGGSSRTTTVVAITGDLDRPPIEILSGASLSSAVALGDIDGDGHPDLVFGQTPSDVKIYYNRIAKGAVIAYAGTDSQTAGTVTVAKQLVIVDYDGDRRNDIVYAASDGVHVIVNHGVKPNSGERTFDDTLVFAAPTAWEPAALTATEFSGDRRPDFVVADGASGKLWFLENSCSFP